MWKVLLVSGIVLVGLGVVAVAVIVPKIRVESQRAESGKRVRVDTPFGSVHVDARQRPVDPGDVPVYPGAGREEKSGGAALDFDWGSGEKHLSVAGSGYTTSDSVDTVRTWYRQRLPEWKVTGKGFEMERNGVKRMVEVAARDGRTRIAVVTFGEPAVN